MRTYFFRENWLLQFLFKAWSRISIKSLRYIWFCQDCTVQFSVHLVAGCPNLCEQALNEFDREQRPSLPTFSLLLGFPKSSQLPILIIVLFLRFPLHFRVLPSISAIKTASHISRKVLVFFETCRSTLFLQALMEMPVSLKPVLLWPLGQQMSFLQSSFPGL